jgi:hypothetical protein
MRICALDCTAGRVADSQFVFCYTQKIGINFAYYASVPRRKCLHNHGACRIPRPKKAPGLQNSHGTLPNRLPKDSQEKRRSDQNERTRRSVFKYLYRRTALGTTDVQSLLLGVVPFLFQSYAFACAIHLSGYRYPARPNSSCLAP